MRRVGGWAKCRSWSGSSADVGTGLRGASCARGGGFNFRHAERLYASDRTGAPRRGSGPDFPVSLGRLSHYGTAANALVLSNLFASVLVMTSLSQGLVGGLQLHPPAGGDVEPASLRTLCTGRSQDSVANRTDHRQAAAGLGRHFGWAWILRRALDHPGFGYRRLLLRFPADRRRISRASVHPLAHCQSWIRSCSDRTF